MTTAHNGRAVKLIGERTYRAFGPGDYIGMEHVDGVEFILQVNSVNEAHGFTGRHYVINYSGPWFMGNTTMVWPNDRVRLYREV